MFETTISLPGIRLGSKETQIPLTPKMQAEQQLIHRAQQGDLAAFNELVITYQEAVYRQAYWVMGEEEAAEDAAQEAFIRAYEKIHTFNGSSFRAWILRIATNFCLDQIRRAKSHPMLALEKVNEDTDEEYENSSWLIAPGASPEQMVEQAELSDTIQNCLMKLAPEYRLPLILIEIQEMNYQEAADVMNMRLGSFKSRLFRARAQFVEIINRTPGFERLGA
jgi:RNA polymerase sigma-70 factor (ECF subfamily)